MAYASLSWLNLFVSDMQTGFGPFVPVRLAAAGWDPGMIGRVLSVGTVAALLAQVPAGMICDAIGAKRRLAAGGIVAIMLALVLVGTRPSAPWVVAAEAIQGVAGVVLMLAITSITLGLAREDKLGERLGSNVRFAAIGGALGAAVLGLVGDRVSHVALFVSAAGLGVPALAALWFIRPAIIARAPLRTGHRAALPPTVALPQRSVRQVVTDPRLLVVMLCVTLFHLANAAMLPLAAGSLERRDGGLADLVVGAAIVIPQLLTAAGSPLVGRLANTVGRRRLLILAYAMLPLRAMLFAASGSPWVTLVAQMLDGVTGATYGVLITLVVADITHEGGRFNLALGLTGLATGVGATISNVVAGSVATHLGTPVAFLTLGAVGLTATLTVALALPETMPLPVGPPLQSSKLAAT